VCTYTTPPLVVIASSVTAPYIRSRFFQFVASEATNVDSVGTDVAGIFGSDMTKKYSAPQH